MALGCPETYTVDLLGMNRRTEGTEMFLLGTLDDLVRVEWSRVLRDVSEATITVRISSQSNACCDLLYNAWRYSTQIRIHRHLNGAIRVWEGEVVQVISTSGSDEVQVICRDIVYRLDRAVNTHNLNYTTAMDIADIAYDIVDRNFYDIHQDPHDDSMVARGMTVIPGPANYKYRPGPLVDYVGNILRRLAQSYGLDFTVVNRTLYLWRRQTGRDQTVARLTSEDISEDMEIVFNLLEAVSYGFATTQQEDSDKTDPGWPGKTRGTGLVGGPWGRLDRLTRVNDPDADLDDLLRAAENLIWNGLPPPIQLRMPGTAKLNATAPIDVPTLIPGVRVDVFVDAPCMSVRQGMRITNLLVEWTPGDGETVSAGFSGLSDVTTNSVTSLIAGLSGAPVTTAFT